MQARTERTLTIEAMVKDGQNNSAIARQTGVSRHWVRQIRKRLLGDYELATQINRRLLSDSETAPATPVESVPPSGSPMKTLTICLTPAVYDALVEACAIANRKAPEESITIVEYIEDLVITQVVEMGLLRKNKRK